MTALKRGFTLIRLLTAKQQGGRNKGFTLIELLIVMAILGVLAVVVLIAINPAEQLARARDAGRISGVNQLGRAISAYFTVNGCLPGIAGPATCPSVAGAWDTDLTGSEELISIPQLIDPAGTCTAPNVGVNGWCYANDGVENFVIYAGLESQQKLTQCGVGVTVAYAGFSSAAARGGVWCGGEPAAGSNPDI
jgi:prepilin-type N-terminal cleavage/methylation domain-containing protein